MVISTDFETAENGALYDTFFFPRVMVTMVYFVQMQMLRMSRCHLSGRNHLGLEGDLAVHVPQPCNCNRVIVEVAFSTTCARSSIRQQLLERSSCIPPRAFIC